MAGHCVEQTLRVSACSPDNNGNVIFSIQCHNFGAVPCLCLVFMQVCACVQVQYTPVCVQRGYFPSITCFYFCECRKYGTFLLRRVLSLQACAIIREHVAEMCLGFHAWYVFFCSQHMRGECTQKQLFMHFGLLPCQSCHCVLLRGRGDGDFCVYVEG